MRSQKINKLHFSTKKKEKRDRTYQLFLRMVPILDPALNKLNFFFIKASLIYNLMLGTNSIFKVETTEEISTLGI